MRQVYVWLQNNKMCKAILDTEKRIFVVFDSNDKLLERRTGLSQQVMRKIRKELEQYAVNKSKPNFGVFFTLMNF